MENQIKNIINSAIKLKRNGSSDLHIAKFVHIELGKILIYNNSYTANFNKENDNEPTQLTKTRQKTILNKKTDIFKKAQICLGMTEIYVAILNKVGINSKVVGVEKKGDVDGASREDGTIIDVPKIYKCYFDNNFEIVTEENEKSNEYIPSHYCAMLEIDGTEYIQDFLIDRALFRIKTQEASINADIPGFCLKEDYESRAKQNLQLAPEYIKRIQLEYEQYTNDPSTEKAFQFLFEQLKKYNKYFGFEEAKDFFLLTSRLILPIEFNPQNLKIINLLKEDEVTCDVISIYIYNDNVYLLRGGDESTTVKYASGKISTEQIKTLLLQGFEERKESDELILKTLMIKKLSNIDVEEMIAGIQENTILREGLCEKDLSSWDLSELDLEHFKLLCFDENTIFSEEQIEKFHPYELLNHAKKPMRSIQSLHDMRF